jgi:signal peptidase I
LRAYVHAVATAIVLTFVMRSCAVQGFRVPSGSMLPTVQVGDHILVSRLAYGIPAPFSGRWMWLYGSPSPGDVVVLERRSEPGSYYVKRVAAVAGEIVEMVDGELIVDGHPRRFAGRLEQETEPVTFRPLRVPPGRVFVLGDNRDQSIDSRDWGPVEISGIKGRVFRIYWSQRKSGGSVRWERLGARIE